jgi:hypothetical protein
MLGLLRRRTVLSAVLAGALLGTTAFAAGGRASITAVELEGWLSYIASDELQGRAVYSEGLGLAGGYISGHLQQWGVLPAGDDHTYYQVVRVLGIKSTVHSTLTVQVGRETRTFKEGDGVVFPKDVGLKRSFTVSHVEFAGYGLDAPGSNYSDLKGRDYSDAAVVFLGASGPKAVAADISRRLLSGRGRWLTGQLHAVASIGPVLPQPNRQAPSNTGSPRQARPDFTTTQRLDLPLAPSVTADDSLLQFLFSRSPVKYDDLRRKAESGEPMNPFRLDDVKLTFSLDNEYEVIRTQLTQNVVGIIEGSDPRLKSTYIAVGAHYDHVGYAETELTSDGKRPSPPGRVTPGAEQDRIWNGADDDGSGTVAVMAIADAFAAGAKPKRSILVVWHAGEERGLLGSQYFADHPTVPIESIVAQLNIDMIGRNRDNLPGEANTVYLVGSDRISTELDGVIRQANQGMDQPLSLNYEMNDPADPEQLYFRSDHYSYAAKGIPVTFFTTGLHPDYHANTDEVSKIEFPKMTRITQMIYETALRLANLDHPVVRDFKGPRAGKGTL